MLSFPSPVRSARSLAVLLLAAAPALAFHGGRFRGPQLPAPAFGTVGAPSRGAAGGGGSLRQSDTEGWSQWWALEKDAYLRVDSALGPGRRPGAGVDQAELSARAVPLLLANLEDSSNAVLLSASLIALAKLGIEPAAIEGEPEPAPLLETLVRFTGHGNQEVAESAVMALGVLGSHGAAPVLGDLLGGAAPAGGLAKTSRRMRALAAYGLGAVGRRTTAAAVRRYCVHHLAQALGERQGSTIDVAVACVVALGHVRLPVTADTAVEKGPLPPSDSRAGQLALLSGMLQDGSLDDDLRSFLPVALARLAHDVPVQREILIQELAGRLDPREREADAVRASCVQALGQMVTAQQVPVDEVARQRLFDVARGGERLERGLALAALGRIGGRREEGLVGKVPALVRDFLLERLEKGKSQERPWAALGLGLLEHGTLRAGKPSSAEVRQTLREVLARTARPDHVGALCIALGLAGDLEALPLLADRAVEGDETARGHAAAALGLLRAMGQIGTLRNLVVQGRQPQVAREAAIALGLLADRGATGALFHQALRARFQSHRISALLCAGLVQDAGALEPLLELLASKDESTVLRGYAAVALGTLADKERIPWSHALAAGVSWWSAPPTLFDPDSGLGAVDVF